MSQTVLPPSPVHSYVAAVRAELSDLSPEDVDDLVGGLEADLAERAAELPPGTDLTAAFGAPEAYAAELRSAAELPPRTPSSPATVPLLAGVEQAARDRRLGVEDRHGWLRDLRPVWWLVRGAALALPLVIVLGLRMNGSGPACVLLLLTGAALSFAWGRRGNQAVSSWPNRLTLLANAAGVLLVLPLGLFLMSPRVEYVDNGYRGDPAISIGGDGVWVNGEAASNLYAYDAEGNRIDRVRLFNQYGQAVAVPAEALSAWAGIPGQEVRGPDGRPLADPVPLKEDGSLDVNRVVFPVRWGDLTGWQASTGGWEPPVKISALHPEPAAAPASPSPSTSLSPSPSDATSPSPSPSATG